MSTKEDLLLAEIADLREQLYRAENPTFNGRLDSWQAACGKARGESELLRNELRELKAENAGLRTGYQAYERVKADLKAENEVIRKAMRIAASRMTDAKTCFDRDFPGEWSGELHLAVAIKEIDAAMAQGDQP